MNVIVKSPSECSSDEIDFFLDLVLQGEEVAAAGLRNRIMNAYRLIFVCGETLLGVGALKFPIAGYRDRVFRKSGLSIENLGTILELGWIYTAAEARGQGVGRLIMEKALEELRGRRCFATTRADNAPMHHLLPEYGFEKQGKNYKSDSGDYELCLFIREGHSN